MMTETVTTTAKPRQPFDIPVGMRWVLAVVGLGLFTLCAVAITRYLLGLTPDTSGWTQGSDGTVLAIHLVTVVPSIPLGVYIFTARKGTRLHRRLGKLWVGLMGVTAIATLFLRQINEGAFSYIHIFSVLTLIVLPLAVIAARQHRVADHKRHLLGVFIGALIVSGGFTFLPGRLMWTWLFG